MQPKSQTKQKYQDATHCHITPQRGYDLNNTFITSYQTIFSAIFTCQSSTAFSSRFSPLALSTLCPAGYSPVCQPITQLALVITWLSTQNLSLIRQTGSASLHMITGLQLLLRPTSSSSLWATWSKPSPGRFGIWIPFATQYCSQCSGCFCSCCWATSIFKKPSLPRLKSDWDGIRQDC